MPGLEEGDGVAGASVTVGAGVAPRLGFALVGGTGAAHPARRAQSRAIPMVFTGTQTPAHPIWLHKVP